MTHFEFIMSCCDSGEFELLAVDTPSKSVLFVADGEICCEINGQPFGFTTREEFWDAVEMFRGDDLSE